MLTANNNVGNRTLAKYATKGEEFFCPLCCEKLILKRGMVRIPHFAHYAYNGCTFSGETIAHMEMKEIMAEKMTWLKGHWNNCTIRNIDIEKIYNSDGEKRISDISVDDVTLSNYRYPINLAIECQHSPILIEEIIKRNCFFKEVGYKPIWMFDFDSFIKEKTTYIGNGRFIRLPSVFSFMIDEKMPFYVLRRGDKNIFDLKIVDFKRMKGKPIESQCYCKTIAFYRLVFRNIKDLMYEFYDLI